MSIAVGNCPVNIRYSLALQTPTVQTMTLQIVTALYVLYIYILFKSNEAIRGPQFLCKTLVA